jgi:hypothetical protein
MRLLVVVLDRWTVLAACTPEDRCLMLEFMQRLSRSDPAEHLRLVRAIDRLASAGPSRNIHQTRHLAQGIHELKTRGGVRVLFFFDEGHIVVCSEAMTKPKPKRLAVAVERAERTRWRYLNDKRNGNLEIVGGR